MVLDVMFVTIIIFLLLSLTSSFDTKVSERISVRARSEEAIDTKVSKGEETSFPRVYNATIRNSLNTSSNFASEVDLIQFHRNIKEACLSISFLVHDNAELAHVKAMATLLSMNAVNKGIHFDLKATLDLHEQINYVGAKKKIPSLYSTIPNFSCYKDLKGSFDWMDAMVKRSTSISGLSITKTDIGDSWLKQQHASQGYDIWALKVTGIPKSLPSSSVKSEKAPKAIIFVMAGLHAREFAPTELASRWIESLIDGYGQDADITAILDVTELHLVLQSNPDGRALVETNRVTMRRKNLNPGKFLCSADYQGVDLNRNFPYRWGLNSGSSPDECAPTFRGTAAASEPEVNAIQKYTESIFPISQRKAKPYAQEKLPYAENKTMGVFVDIHSFGNAIFTPWGYSDNINGNARGFQAIIDKIQSFNNFKENSDYPFTSGSSDDFAYGRLGVASMTFEVGNMFFQDCKTFETSILTQNLPALTYLAKLARAPFHISKGPDIINLSAIVKGNFLIVNVTASDSAFSYSGVSTSQQSIRHIRVFLNIHPYSVSSSNLTKAYMLKSGSRVIDVSHLASQRYHVVYAEATDSAGYTGPITAKYFFK